MTHLCVVSNTPVLKVQQWLSSAVTILRFMFVHVIGHIIFNALIINYLSACLPFRYEQQGSVDHFSETQWQPAAVHASVCTRYLINWSCKFIPADKCLAHHKIEFSISLAAMYV